jgi:hypothetical protein
MFVLECRAMIQRNVDRKTLMQVDSMRMYAIDSIDIQSVDDDIDDDDVSILHNTE